MPASVPALFIISAIVFLLAAGLQLINIRTKRKTPLIIRSLGFLLLAIATVSPIINLINALTTAIITIISSLLITSSYILQRLQTSYSNVPSKPSSLDTPDTKHTPITKNKKEYVKQRPSTLPPPKPALNKPAPEKQQPIQAKITPAQTTRSAIKKETGLRAKPLIKLPAQRRKKARTVINTLVGFLVFFLVGWGSYTIAKRIIKPQQTSDINTIPVTEDATSPLPPDNIQLVPLDDNIPSKQETPTEEPTEKATEDQEKSEPTPKNNLTIKDTETGWLNVREGASTATPIITTIDPGDTYEFLEENESGTWYKIQIDGNTAGWISAKYADKDK